MLVFFSVLYHTAKTCFSWTCQEPAKKAELHIPQDICGLKSSLFPSALNVGMLPEMFKYEMNKAAMPSTRMFCISKHWARCPQPEEAGEQKQEKKIESLPLNTCSGIKKENSFVMRYCSSSQERYEPNLHQSHLN